ncbi:hypothetical protein KR009_009128 [Drosophila setifemur]|nr:hypothetical protein KR009_009128 [Drosophila setifemur]
MWRWMLFLGIVLAIHIGLSLAECNVCSSLSGTACVSQNQYQNCSASRLPTGPVYTCPNNTYCSTSMDLCSATVTDISCADCNKCDGTQKFTCTGPSRFAFCSGVTVLTSEYTCSAGEVCNIGNPNACGTPASGNPATCSFYGNTTVVADFCTTKASMGRFPYPFDTDCSRYVYCFLKNTTWTGNTWNCPSTKPYFDVASTTCNALKPANCV